jgi:archaeosine-15-forming tRNA-guanine transglycosylase
MKTAQENIFVEFIIDGVIKIPEKDKSIIIDEIKKILLSTLSSKDIIKIDTNINVISEKDLMFAVGMASNSVEN